MKKKAFEVLVLFHSQQAGGKEWHTEVIIPTELVLAKDEKSAANKTIRKVDEKYDLDDVEIIVRSF